MSSEEHWSELPEGIRRQAERESEAFWRAIGGPFPNTREGDIKRRDAGVIPETGFAAYLDVPGIPEPGWTAVWNLIQRVAISYGIEFDEEAKWNCAKAPKLEQLVLCLIRDHCRDQFELPRQKLWTSNEKRSLVHLVEFTRRVNNLTSDEEALVKISRDRHYSYFGIHVETLRNRYQEGKRLIGRELRRGRPPRNGKKDPKIGC